MLKYTAGIFKIQTFLRATSAVKAEFYHRREAESGEFAGGPYARTAMFPIWRPLGEGKFFSTSFKIGGFLQYA